MFTAVANLLSTYCVPGTVLYLTEQGNTLGMVLSPTNHLEMMSLA